MTRYVNSLSRYHPEDKRTVGDLARQSGYRLHLDIERVSEFYRELEQAYLAKQASRKDAFFKTDRPHEKRPSILSVGTREFHLQMQDPTEAIKYLEELIPNGRTQHLITLSGELYSQRGRGKADLERQLRIVSEYGFHAGISLLPTTSLEILTDTVISLADVVTLLATQDEQATLAHAETIRRLIRECSERGDLTRIQVEERNKKGQRLPPTTPPSEFHLEYSEVSTRVLALVFTLEPDQINIPFEFEQTQQQVGSTVPVLEELAESAR